MARLLGILLIAIPPLLGAWVASSLTAWLGGPKELALFAGLLLFPVLPVLWQLDAARRRKPDPPGATPKRRLSAFTRLVIRTYVINLAFLVVIGALFPHAAFPALAVRGDWMLEGRDGAAADLARTLLHGAARGLEWLYTLTRDDKYKQFHDDEPLPDPERKPPPPPTPTPPADAWPVAVTLHPAVLALTPADEKSPATVALFLRGHTKKGADRVHALHDYVADRITYDTAALRSGNFPPQDADTVFRTRMGVCAGYAALLKKLGDLAGEKIVYLHGDAVVGSHIDSHAWNAAQLDDGWALIDATWDAGGINDNGVFEKRFDTAYLFAPAKFFVATHYPSDRNWQLLDQPVDHGEFLRMPKLRADFFRAGLKLLEPTRAQVDATGSVDVVVENPAHRYLSASVCGHGRCDRCGGEGAGATKLTCKLPATGKYDVTLFAGIDPTSNRLEDALEVEVNSR